MKPIRIKFNGRDRLAFVQDFRDEDTHFQYLYEEAMKLRAKGLFPREIALKLRMNKGTVAGWCYGNTKGRGRPAGFVIKMLHKWYHVCDPRIEYEHPDWEQFILPNGENVYIVPSKMNGEVDNMNRKF